MPLSIMGTANLLLVHFRVGDLYSIFFRSNLRESADGDLFAICLVRNFAERKQYFV